MPVLLITDRSDHALTLADELGFWAPAARRYLFPEPNPLFYEIAAWGGTIRRDRLQALSTLAAYHIRGAEKPDPAPFIVTSARAIMTRTLPRRDLLKATRDIQPGQNISLDTLVRQWTDIGYQFAETVLEPGQFSRRGGRFSIYGPHQNRFQRGWISSGMRLIPCAILTRAHSARCAALSGC